MKKYWRTAYLTIAVAVCAIAVVIAIWPNGRDMAQLGAAAFVYGISSGEDVDECSKIVETFLQRHDIPKNSKSKPGQSPVFCNPGSNGVVFKVPPSFVIYGTVDKITQDQYLSTLESIQSKIGTNKLQVEFYEQENWLEWKSSRASGGHRGPERLLRKITLIH